MKRCPRCNQWRTRGQMAGEVCGACTCAGPECTRRIYCKGLCSPHYRAMKAGRPLRKLNRTNRPISDLIADVKALSGTDTPEHIAARIGLKLSSIERQLARAKRRDLWHRLNGKAA